VTLLRLAGGALGVALWFALWALAARKMSGGAGPLLFRIEVIEAILLTLFAALWFASLGHGGWWLLFGVLGLLIEGPVRARHRAGEPPGTAAWRPLVLGTLRIVGAGGILSLLL
jgi:hypothetical protein